MRTVSRMDDLPMCRYINNIPSGIMAAEMLHDLRCHVDNTPILGKYGENVAIACIVEATKRQQSKGRRLGSGHDKLGVYTNAEDDEDGDEKSEAEDGAEQEMNDDGREAEDNKEHTPTQDLADNMAAAHILDATGNVGKSYRAATTDGAAAVRLEHIGAARKGEGTAMGTGGEGRSGYARGGVGRCERMRTIPPSQQHEQAETDTRQQLTQLQATVAVLVHRNQELQQAGLNTHQDAHKDSGKINDRRRKETTNVTVPDVNVSKGET
eukprot:gene11864-24859_t